MELFFQIMQVMEADASSRRKVCCLRDSSFLVTIPQTWMRDDGGIDESCEIMQGLNENDLIISKVIFAFDLASIWFIRAGIAA
jgi:hypothetical protein